MIKIGNGSLEKAFEWSKTMQGTNHATTGGEPKISQNTVSRKSWFNNRRPRGIGQKDRIATISLQRIPGWLNCGSQSHAALRTFAFGSLSFSKNYVFVYYFLFVLQVEKYFKSGTVVASMPHSITFASRYKKNCDVTEA